MKSNHPETIRQITREIMEIAKDLPTGKSHQIINRCNKLQVLSKKVFDMKNNTTTDQSTSRQIGDRYNAKKAIFEAMCAGRKVSFLDSREFEVSEFHTQICNIRQDIERGNLPWELKDQWITFGKRGKRCKLYWLEGRTEA